MIRTQIRLTPEQMTQLQELAAKRQVSVSELIRQGVDRMLQEALSDQEIKRPRALAAVGRFESDVNDLGTNDDIYLAEAFSATE